MKQLSTIFAVLALATGIRISTTGPFALPMLENVHLEGRVKIPIGIVEVRM